MTTSPNRRGRFGRRFVGGLCAGSLALQMGCYSFQPVQTSLPAAGQRIAVVLNDRGRLMVGDRLGSSIDKADGLLVAVDSGGVTLEVYRTFDMRGNPATWTGERVQVPRDGISGYQERQFSKRRTAILVGVTVGAVAASLLLANLNVFGSLFSHEDKGGGTPSGEAR